MLILILAELRSGFALASRILGTFIAKNVFCTCQFFFSPFKALLASKRSLSARSLCSILPFRSVVPPSAFGHHFTRSLCFVRRGYFPFSTLFDCSASLRLF